MCCLVNFAKILRTHIFTEHLVTELTHHKILLSLEADDGQKFETF